MAASAGSWLSVLVGHLEKDQPLIRSVHPIICRSVAAGLTARATRASGTLFRQGERETLLGGNAYHHHRASGGEYVLPVSPRGVSKHLLLGSATFSGGIGSEQCWIYKNIYGCLLISMSEATTYHESQTAFLLPL